ncbi:MAG TPA: DUF2071 domain-containing protein [Nitrolancea sp.]|nr:DUF2071 domain-containing protein [Nitrolancea sp.]
MERQETTRPMLAPPERRPWPLPEQPWVMRQSWRDLLFMHWPLPPEQVRPLLPAALPLDTWEGEAWVSVVPFRMRGVTGRGLPAFPWLSSFPELNVRTYVTLGGKPGVYFFSLDAGNILAVWAARLGYHLPYFHADMLVWREQEWITYCSHRVHRGARVGDLLARYRPTGPVTEAPLGSLGAWLSDRYALYTVDRRGRPLRAEIDHATWPLQPAEVEIFRDTLSTADGLALSGPPALLGFARRVDMHAWLPERVETG